MPEGSFTHMITPSPHLSLMLTRSYYLYPDSVGVPAHRWSHFNTTLCKQLEGITLARLKHNGICGLGAILSSQKDSITLVVILCINTVTDVLFHRLFHALRCDCASLLLWFKPDDSYSD